MALCVILCPFFWFVDEGRAGLWIVLPLSPLEPTARWVVPYSVMPCSLLSFCLGALLVVSPRACFFRVIRSCGTSLDGGRLPVRLAGMRMSPIRIGIVCYV